MGLFFSWATCRADKNEVLDRLTKPYGKILRFEKQQLLQPSGIVLRLWRTDKSIDKASHGAIMYPSKEGKVLSQTKRKVRTLIKREYHTKEECVGLFMDEDFDRFPSWVVTNSEDWYENWEFCGLLDEEEAEEQEEEYGYVDVPMWNTWFIPRGFTRDWIERHEEEAMDCGFTLIYNDGDLFAIGVDGAGYSFRDAHFTQLYDAMGTHWHDED